jgi:hypothetical protein
MSRTSWLPMIAVVAAAVLWVLAVMLPWAYIGGRAVGLDWVEVDVGSGLPAVILQLIPTVLAGVAAIVAIASPKRRRWAVLVTTGVGLFAGYNSVALARAIPTMAAIWAGTEGSRGPAFVAIIAAETILILAAWSTLLVVQSLTFAHAE